MAQRVKALLLTPFENGWLYAAIPKDKMERMKTECPRMWLRLQILFTESYEKHPTLGKQARDDVARYTKELRELIKQEEEYEAKQK